MLAVFVDVKKDVVFCARGGKFRVVELRFLSEDVATCNNSIKIKKTNESALLSTYLGHGAATVKVKRKPTKG